jgi:Domain of unknown function (DUF4177)
MKRQSGDAAALSGSGSDRTLERGFCQTMFRRSEKKSSPSGPQMAPMPQTHVYKVLELTSVSSTAGDFGKNLNNELNAHAREGWRVISIEWGQAGNKHRSSS